MSSAQSALPPPPPSPSPSSSPPHNEENVLVMQTIHDSQLTFDIVRAATEVHNAVASAQYWERDLRAIIALTMLLSIVAGVVLAGYAVTLVDDRVWPVFSLQMVLLALCIVWVFVSYYRSKRSIEYTLYANIALVVVVCALLILWVTLYRHVLRNSGVLWKSLFGVLVCQTVVLLAGASALGTLLSCRMTFDAHICIMSGIMEHTNTQRKQQQKNIGSSIQQPQQQPHSTVGNGALFISAIAPSIVRAASKNVAATVRRSSSSAAAAKATSTTTTIENDDGAHNKKVY
jgi:hypothetical protein